MTNTVEEMRRVAVLCEGGTVPRLSVVFSRSGKSMKLQRIALLQGISTRINPGLALQMRRCGVTVLAILRTVVSLDSVLRSL
jgi:hypothetical protein